MLLTSWVKSMRVAFEKSRKATLNPRRRLQLRSVPSSARQKIQRRVAIEQLEDRTLLTSLIINQLTAGLGVTLNNSVLDPDADGVSNFDSIIFEDLTIDATSGSAVSIDLDNLTFTDPFTILFDNVSITSSTGIGVDIQLSNLLVDTIAVDSSTISGSVGNAFNLDLTNVIADEFNIIDSTLSGQAGAGVTVALNASTLEESSVRRSTVDGVAFDVTNGSVLRHTTMTDNSITGTSGSDGVSLNLVDSIAEEFRLTNNNSIQGVSINVDDTVDGDAALLTELFIHSNIITGNTEGAGVQLTLNNVDQFASITENSITANSSHGIVFDQTDGDLSGDISGNIIANNVGHGIFFSPSTTNPPPTGDGAPGVPAFAGVPGPTDKIDFAAARNEVQLITFAGIPTSGSYTISYTGGDGVTETTAGILATATASQVKAAMVAAFSEIGVGDILVNGNFQDGYEVEFINAVGGRNINPLAIDPTGFNSAPASISVTQSSAGNVNEEQHLELSGIPTFGFFTLTFELQTSAPLSYLDIVPSAAAAARLATELNALAALAGHDTTLNPIVVTNTATGFDIEFTGTMGKLNVGQVSVDSTGLRLFTDVVIGPAELNPNKPSDQTITFVSIDENGVLSVPQTPTGGVFRLTFQGETTGDIVVDADPLVTAANIDAALQALPSATTKTGVEGDFIVTGDFTNGFVVEFNEIQHLGMLGANDPTFGSFDLTFLGQTTSFSFTTAIPSPARAITIQNALNNIANGQGFTGSPVSVVVAGNGYDIIFLDSGTLANVDIPQITTDASAMQFNVVIANSVQGDATTNEEQTLNFINSGGAFPFTFAANGVDITNPPIGAAFRIFFAGEFTSDIVIDTDPAVTAANIDAALEALSFSTSPDDFAVTGNYTNGFVITFQGDLEFLNVPLMFADVFPLDVVPSTLVGNFDLTTVVPIVGTTFSADPLDPFALEPFIDVVETTTVEGIELNEQQTISIPNVPGGGTYDLDFPLSTNGPVTLAFDATAAEVQAALESLDSIGAGNVLVTGSVFTGGFVVEFIGAFRAESPSDILPFPNAEITIDDTGILIVVPTVTTVSAGTTLNEVQEVLVNGTPTAGDFTLSFDGATTGPIAFDADAAAIIAALVALPTLNPGEVMVRGNALTGFEIEYVGNLATINTPQVSVDDTNLTGATLTVKTTTVGGYLRGIRGNIITGNSGAGVEIDLDMFTSFYGDIAGNTIGSNENVGVKLTAADTSILHSIDFSLSVDGNTMNDNRGAGIVVFVEDTATGDVSITNNTITETRNDNNLATPFFGAAVYVHLLGTDVSFEAISQLRDLTIDGNYLGTDATNTGGLGNAQNGITIHIEESTIIDRTQISSNVISNNIGGGIFFHREDDARVGRAIVDPIVGEERAVLIHSNTISGNVEGISILAQNGSLTTTDFEIKDNLISGNVRDGVSLHAEADASIFADIINNVITFNAQNGIESTTRTTSYFGTDRRDVAGTWIQNEITNNTRHGVRISGRIGNRVELVPHYLFIGLDGVDPVTGLDRGNLIQGNGRDGIQIAAHQDRIAGNVKIANNSILSNATGGIELLGEGLTSSIDENLIAFNTGKGIDINSNGQTIFMRNNVITENTADGLEVLAANQITHSEDNFTFTVTIGGPTTSLTAIGNFIDNNGGRGVDLQTEEQANSDFIFGDGTETGANRIVSNALEGFYVITTASRGQDQDADSTTTLDATGNVTTSDADMVLQVDRNYIQDNGVNSNFTTTGFVMRIGSMASTNNFTSQTPGTDVSVGDEDSSNFANGRSNVSFTNNEFEGNFGEDVYIDSFTSTVDPPTTQDLWDSASTPPFRVLTTYRRDPLAKLNLVFEGNTGNGLNVTNVGAFYDNAEPIFKSRVANGTATPNPDGPFPTSSAVRRRNAQRVASRTNLAPFTAPNPAPTAVGTVADAFIPAPGGPIQITTTTAHGLFSGSTVEIQGVFSDEVGFFTTGLSSANGVFVIDVIDANNFTLRSTEGAILGNVFQNNGTWSFNDNGAFLYDGMGVSTFRIAHGFDGVNNSFVGTGGFQSGDSFLNSVVRPGTRVGELSYNWDIWTPDADTFLAPFTSTFLTADISVAVPDPTSGAINPLIISFTEDVVGVDITDFILLRNNVVVDLVAEGAVLTQLTSRTFELDLTSVTGVEGEYDLRLVTNGSISDAKYINPSAPLGGFAPINFLSFGDVERFTVDTTAPVADIVDVSPDPRSDAAGEVIVNFTEDVNGVDLSDFTITFDGGIPVDLSSTPATLTQVTGSQFVLDLSQVSSLSGDYVLTLNAGGSSITDLAGNALAANAVDSWVNDTLAPIAQFENVVDPVASGHIPSFRVTLNFSENVTGLSITDFTLDDGNGTITPLTIANAVLTQVTPSQYEIDLGTLADTNGIYTLTYNAGVSAVQDASGNQVAGSTSETWQKGLEVIAPTGGIQDITPDPRPSGSVVGVVLINFSEDVTGVDITDFELLFDDGSGQVSIALGGLTLVGGAIDSVYTIDLSLVTAADGDYTFNLLADGTIADLEGNLFTTGASDSWRTGGTGPVATIEDLPPVLLTNAGVVTVDFSQAVTGVDITDFQLTLNGQNVSLAGLSVTPISGTQYSIDLSSVTSIFGNYAFSLIAAGSNIRNISSDPILNNATETWVTSSNIDLDVSSPVFTDGIDSVAGDGVIGNGTAGTQTLRAAIQEANALAGSNSIDLAAGTYVLSIGGIDEDLSAMGDLDIRDNLTIRGQGVGVTIIDGGALDRIFQVFAGITLNLENLTITNGALTGSSDGAGIRNSGTTTLTNVEVTGNVSADSGGGLNNTGLMIIVDSTISGNTAGGSGGGIRNTGTLEVTRSTISGNSTERDGGAIFNAGAGNVTLSNSTFSGNTSVRSGGAIRNTATMTATNNTFTLNGAGTNGGGISNTGTSTLQNNLVIGNTAATNVELQGDFISLGGNLTGLLGSATGIGALDIVDVADPTPVLDLTLADNGGPTLTHALLLGSIAIDAGANIGVDEFEQRGSTRILGSSVDIGAVEFGAFFVNSFLDTVDDAPGDGIAADVDGNLTLRAAVMEANALAGDSVIILGAGTYDLTILNEIDSDLNDSTTGDLDITDITGSLSIVGAGSSQTIINASGLSDRVFDVLSGTSLILQGLTVTGGHAVGGSGGGIRNVGTLSLLNSLVDTNTADIDGGGILNGQLGLQGILNMTNSTVSNNGATGDGGGIFNNDQSTVTLVDSNVTGNTAASDGGGIFNDLQATIDLTRSSISNNTATLDGGGIYNNDLASLTINDSKVNSNTADQGAGIFNEEAASLTVNRTTLSGNNALLHGGGIYNDEGVVVLSDVSILTNTAASDGGGFYNASAGDVTITNSFLDDNTAGRDGGGIANFGVSLFLSGTIVRDSEAFRNGGGLFNDQEEGAVNLTSSSFINNEAVAGGGIFNQELGVINLDLSDISANISSTNGGGIYNRDDATINLLRTTVDGNTAANDGAGIFNEHNAQLNVSNSTVSNNIATRFGGGVYNNSVALTEIVNATISGNDAEQGGGIYNDEEGSMEVTNTTIFNNSATTGGGILNAVDGFVSVANSIIAGNDSVSPGPDVTGDFDSRGNNLIGVGGVSTGFTDGVNGDLVGTFGAPISPGLGELQDNGGATFTHELLGGSLARDAGNNFFAPTDDQRGFARLFDGDGNGSLIVDIGAFESGYIVTSFDDSVDASPGDGVSVDANGQSTLRAAVMEANARSGADTILLGAGVYTLSLFGHYEDNALLGDLDITDDLTIIGAGSGRTIIDADFLDRIFHILTGINVSIRGVTLVNGDVTRVEDGGAILNYGTLFLEDVEIRNSLANRGGGLFNNGVATITDSFFTQNTAIAGGGAIFNSNSAIVSLTMSTLSGNDAENGGGIYNTTTGTLEVVDTTLDGNTATVAGGAIFNASTDAVGNGEGGDDSGDPPPPPPPESQYTIDVVFTDSSLTASQQAIFQQAADRWSEIIRGDVPDVVVAGIGLVDDLSIQATAPAIDGVGGILGQAGPTVVRSGSFIPAAGIMQFDSADLAALEASGQLVDVILHEMGHVIGIGTIWNSLGLLLNGGTADPRFTGANAIAEYNALLGRNVVDIPVEGSAGPGTNDAHWRETDLNNELMTGFLNSGVVNPISTITIGSLADLGYVVDLSAADVFPLQAPDVQLLDPVPLGQMLDMGELIVLDESAFVNVGAGSDHDHPVNELGDEEHYLPKYENDAAEAASVGDVPPFPTSDTFNLSSLPSANHTIYLDFNGHTTTGTFWNDAYGTVVTPAYDTDNNVGSFSMAEHEVMQRTWQRVAEDFAPFNVNVTTVEPPSSDLINSGGADTRWGVRVVIGENTWYPNSAGGVAYLTSFNYDTDTPTFVFNASLVGVSEAVSHEVGHTLGLNHDGTSALEYYPGHGIGATGWAPIMGVGYSQDLVQWSSGEYADANNGEDDLSIITTQNGFGYRTDDHGNGIGFASTVTGGTASGIVERNTDVDYFQFTTTGGDVIIDPFVDSSNLDILANLYDSTGTQIQTSNPIGALNASFIGLSAGTYFVSIEGTGEGSVSGTGYSDYSSLGQYTITFDAEPPAVEVGSVTISNSTISNNFAGTRGGGLLNEDQISLSNVTFSGNEAGKEGGAIHNTGALAINNTTIYNNTTEGAGGGIYSVALTASVSVQNTIIAGNHALLSGYDIEGAFTSAGNNLIGTPDTATGFIDGFVDDIVGSNAQRIDPVVSVLQDNGGPTFTHALLAGSLAIDAGDNTDGVVIDQRGAIRPTDTTSDIGAYEIVTPTISIADISQVETNSGTTVFEILVSLSNVNVDEVTVDYETSNGTAIGGIDYEFTTGTVTFSPGETTQTIEVIVNGDTDVEDHETFFVNLFNAVGGLIVDNQSQGTILNDEAAISISDVILAEGPIGTTTNFNFMVTLSTPVAGTVTVDLQTMDGSALLADADYVDLPLQTITFNPGETSKMVTVVVNGDSNIESDETFSVELSNQSANATIADPIGVGTIENDDFALLSISDVTLTEDFDDPAFSLFRFTVSLSQAAGAPVSVLASTADGTAISALGDYDAFSNVLINFSAVETVQTIDVLVHKDAFPNEGNETFFVNLSSSINANIADGQGVGTIVENGIVVTTFDDIVNPVDGVTSLREAITQANNTVGEDNIILLPGIYNMAIPGVGENGNATGDFDILDDVNIFGQGSNSTIIDANGIDRIFHSGNGVSINLSNMELRNGDADDGGALLAQGPTTLNKLIFRDNNADFLGGAIVSAGQLEINDAQFLNNHAGFQGGALYQFQDTATIARSTFSDNTSDARAGAVYVASAATLDISQSLFNNNDSGSRGGAIYNAGTTISTNVTFSGNHSGSRGGAIFNDGSLNVLNNTLTLNTADQSGGGIANDSAVNPSAVATLVNTIVAGNSGALGNDNLDGGYDAATSFNNLIGTIDTATGLVDGDNGNIVGTMLVPVDPNLGILLDNGGPTRTHSLLFGSLAIDAGRNASAPLVDQRGLTRPVDGNLDTVAIADIGAVELQSSPPPPLFGTSGDASDAEEQTNVQISVVKNRTVVSSDGHTFALPGNEDWIHEWDSFWVEVWVDTASGFGISDVLTNIAYDTAYFTATSVEFGSNFTFNRTVVIDDAAGVVRNLGGSTIQSNVGGTGLALLARIKFESLANDQVEVDPAALTFGPLELGLDVQDTEITITGVGEVIANVGALPETDLYPVIYDINDDDQVNFRDLMIFASVYSQDVYSSSSEFVAAMDFDKSGRVDFRDLTHFAANYGKQKSGNTQINFPENFGQKWIGTSLEVASGDDSIGEVIEAAVNTWETALGLDEPLEVQVIVRDFGTAQLGSGQTTEYDVDGVPVGGRVVIDDDANGLGWHVDVTDLPTGDVYDLYTVLLHEIGHVLGFTRYFSGFENLVESDNNGDLTFVGSDFTVALDATGFHVEDPAYLDDLMSDSLDPGVRKTPSAINVQMLLEAYQNAGAVNGDGASAPIFGTNLVPTTEAEPVLVKSIEAAQTFVEQSTVGFVAPAAIKNSEEESSLVSIRQVATFDVIQPSLVDQTTPFERSEVDETIFDDLYSTEFEDSLSGADTDDRQLVFAHADNDLADDFSDNLESMDEDFSNWEGPLL